MCVPGGLSLTLDVFLNCSSLLHRGRVSQSNLELADPGAASRLSLGIWSLPSEGWNYGGPLFLPNFYVSFGSDLHFPACMVLALHGKLHLHLEWLGYKAQEATTETT